jgi:hypothetical protein
MDPYMRPYSSESTDERWRVARAIARGRGDLAAVKVLRPYREIILSTWRLDAEEAGNAESGAVDLRIEEAEDRWREYDKYRAERLGTLAILHELHARTILTWIEMMPTRQDLADIEAWYNV